MKDLKKREKARTISPKGHKYPPADSGLRKALLTFLHSPQLQQFKKITKHIPI